jgi:polyhydroxyalkanoate synthesis regulator phasin
MAEVKEETAKQFDPFASFRQMRDAYLDAMAKTMVETVNSEAYAQTTGAMLDCYLSASAPVREAMEKSMAQAMQQLSLPSRQDVASLAERLTNLEMRIDDLDAKLDRVLNLLGHLRSTPPTGQTESRKRPTGEPPV